jgi:hypothetical protein
MEPRLTLALDALREIEACTDIAEARTLARLARRVLDAPRGNEPPEPEPARDLPPWEPQSDVVRRMGTSFGEWLAHRDHGAKKARAKEQAVALLRDKPRATYAEIAAATGRDVNHVYKLLDDLAADGRIIRGRGNNRVIERH